MKNSWEYGDWGLKIPVSSWGQKVEAVWECNQKGGISEISRAAILPSIHGFYFNLELKVQSSSPPVSPPLRVTWKCETNSCCKERGNFRWLSNSCNLLGGSEQLGFLLLHSLLSSSLSSSFRSRELSEDKQHHETGGCPTPPAPANVAVPRWFIAASEQCRYR